MITILIRTVIIYIILMTAMRLMGKRQIGELDVSDLVTTLLLSEIASLPITDSNIPVSHAVIPIVALLTFEVASSYLLVKFPSIKNLVSARPSVLINKGKIDRKAMLRARLSLDELISEMRQKGISDISEVQYAILEQNGKITVIQKSRYKPVTAEQMNIDVKEAGIIHIIVCEGKINETNLKKLGIPRRQIDEKLKKSGIDLDNVYLMTIDDTGKTQIIRKE